MPSLESLKSLLPRRKRKKLPEDKYRLLEAEEKDDGEPNVDEDDIHPATPMFEQYGVNPPPLANDEFISLSDLKNDRQPSYKFHLLTECQPKHTYFDGEQIYEKILKFFHNWPENSPPDNVHKESLARAGFVYIGDGTNDHVECFSCGLRLRHWEGDDDPWLIHTDLSPACAFVKKLLGEDYAKKVPPAPTEDSAAVSTIMDLNQAITEMQNSRSNVDQKDAEKPRDLIVLDPGAGGVDLVESTLSYRGNEPSLMAEEWTVKRTKN